MFIRTKVTFIRTKVRWGGPPPHLGFADHISIMLVSAYRPLLKCCTPTQRTITVWPSDAVFALQGEVHLEDYTSAVLGYIQKCVEDVTTTRTITCYPNQKPWLNAEVRSLLKARDTVSGLVTARRELTAEVKRAKAAFAQRI